MEEWMLDGSLLGRVGGWLGVGGGSGGSLNKK